MIIEVTLALAIIFLWWSSSMAVAFTLVGFRRSSSKSKACDKRQNKRHISTIPSPGPRLPIIGHLYLLQGNPVLEMSEISKRCGDIYSLQLGSFDAVVVSSLPLIKEVLMQKGSDFGDRPSFLRYSVLFGNDKDNSLAFCDWSQVQKTRRSLARRFCHTGIFADRMQRALDTTKELLISHILKDIESNTFNSMKMKLHVQKACANIFFDFFCSEVCYDWDNDTEFGNLVRLFDEIFWEINQGHPTDVLPFLAPFFRKHLKSLAGMGVDIRSFVMKKIISSHLERLDKDNPMDFVDILLTHLEDADPKERLTEDQVLYELEDFIGGHSAVSNLLCRTLVEIAASPVVADKLYETFFNEGSTDYVQAVIYETLRKTCSPIVPHVASVDSTIGEYPVKKGTIVMINNYDLNTSPDLWEDPHSFSPDRFLHLNKFRKPGHFFPFSYGKRACMGYQLVEKVTQDLILELVRHFHITKDNEQVMELPRACVAIDPQEDLKLRITLRRER